MSWIHTILHPTDFSEDAAEAFRLASMLAHDYQARLVALHVEPSEFVYSGFIGGPTPDLYREELWTQLRSLATRNDAQSVEPILAQGVPVDEILRVAKEMDCDLIVMGTQGRTGLGRLLMGSVAEAVIRGAERPVLTVKCQRREKSEASPREPLESIPPPV